MFTFGPTCADVLVVLPVLVVLAGLWVHGSVCLCCSGCCGMLDLRLWVAAALRRNHSRRCEKLVYRRTEICHLRRVQGPVVELGLAHALL